jgi:hypothetical protein
MSDPRDTNPLKLPAEKTSEKIQEPFDPDKRPGDEDDSEGQPDQPDGEK